MSTDYFCCCGGFADTFPDFMVVWKPVPGYVGGWVGFSELVTILKVTIFQSSRWDFFLVYARDPTTDVVG
jgi:hypothetical protein